MKETPVLRWALYTIYAQHSDPKLGELIKSIKIGDQIISELENKAYLHVVEGSYYFTDKGIDIINSMNGKVNFIEELSLLSTKGKRKAMHELCDDLRDILEIKELNSLLEKLKNKVE